MKSLHPLVSALAIAGGSLFLSGCGQSEFRLCAYNIKGLPSDYSDYDPAENVPKISEIINRMNEDGDTIDVLMVEENFVPEYKFLISTDYPYRHPVPELCLDRGYKSEDGWENCGNLLQEGENYKKAKTNSGLSTFSFFPVRNSYGWAWEDKCHGVVDSGWDCTAPKGFSKNEIEIAPGVWADIYHLHADSGEGMKDQYARELQFKMIAETINLISPLKAVILAGDFNEYMPQTLDIIRNSTGLVDLCDLYPCSEKQIDRIMVRDGVVVHIEPLDFYILENFTGDKGMELSDHKPVCAELKGYSSIPGHEGLEQQIR